ncbi:MAG: ComF family protein [Chitinophagaceae bacterium]|nr:ComF family protein [Chitinophagaceae bacterium]
MKIKTAFFSGLTNLFYPHTCAGCGSDLVQHDNFLCLHCINELPHTDFAFHKNNPVEKIFWGRLQLIAAMSTFYFTKDALIQTLIHSFKYKGERNIGHYLGTMMGNSMLMSGRFNTIDMIIPLPLFAAKERRRGFNQAAILCNGISEIMNVHVVNHNVERRKFTETQTKKHRNERWENVSGSFQVNNPQQLKDKHILLVDDVVTTGATLEACGAEILKFPGTRLSIATLAFATK